MWLIIVYTCFYLPTAVLGLWNKDIKCPSLCTCRLEHITETAIHRFMQQNNEKDKQPEAIMLEDNDVLYEDDYSDFEASSFIRSATCIVQTETKTEELLNEIPQEIQSITLIQASDSGNKSVKFSHFARFPELTIVELQSAQKLKKDAPASVFICDVDAPLEKLEYLNLERVVLSTSKRRRKPLDADVEEETVTFRYVQKSEDGSHPLTFVHRGAIEKILPYKTYVENQQTEGFPMFIGFFNLILLRIYECELNSINWEMFEDLSNLNYLILEKNNLRFVSDFAFYGTPNLKSLSLARNNLLNIQITDLAGLLELEYLDLSHNNFSQLSELSLPPFPRLKLANFANNPITVVFPYTFEVMNTTDSLILGGADEPLTLQTNSFVGLKMLKTLMLLHLDIPLLVKEILVGMPSLKVLSLTGNIPEIQYDAFVEVMNLESLFISKCNITTLSMDSFYGLENLHILDLSKNNLETLPPGIFDDLKNLKEVYLNDNRFQTIPRDVFAKTHLKLIRLNGNPWNCSCEMSDWKPLLVNRIKQKSIKACENHYDKGAGCTTENSVYYKYVYETRVAPKCATPKKYKDWSVFHVMRKQFKCPEFKPKLKKKVPKVRRLTRVQPTNATKTQNAQSLEVKSNENLVDVKSSEHLLGVKSNEQSLDKSDAEPTTDYNVIEQKSFIGKNSDESTIKNDASESEQETTLDYKKPNSDTKHVDRSHKLDKIKRKLALELKYKKSFAAKQLLDADLQKKLLEKRTMQENGANNFKPLDIAKTISNNIHFTNDYHDVQAQSNNIHESNDYHYMKLEKTGAKHR